MGGTDPVADVRAAIAEVRREAAKAAGIHAVVDAALATLLARFALELLGGPVVEREVVPPGPLAAVPAIEIGLAVAVLVGFAVGIAEFAIRVRRPAVERFEAVNPPVAEALRTARDAVEAGEANPVARRLYVDVIDRLRATSSLGLLDLRRLGVTVVLVLVVSLATVQASVAGIEVTGGPAVPGDGPDVDAGGGTAPAPTTLQPGDAVLGEPEDVTAGSENLSAEVALGTGAGGEDPDRAYDEAGLPVDAGPVEVQRAGYAPAETLEDADLIREYNVRIREGEDG